VELLAIGGAPLRCAGEGQPPRFLRSPAAFVAHYVRRRWLNFTALAVVAIGAACCGVGVQYGMKLLVDAMSAPGERGHAAIWNALFLFLALIALESVLWRASGWLGSRATIATGVELRLDLLSYATGHPMRFFQENFAGSLGHRITATAGALGLLVNRSVWDVTPPVVNFGGAFVLFLFLDVRMAVALAIFVLVTTAGLIAFGVLGRPLHRKYAEHASLVSGELIDVIANIWAVKAFSARERERERLDAAFTAEGIAQRRSWLFTEKTRIAHDILLWIMAGSMLTWALLMWRSGRITTGDVVVVSALTFRILHGSRDLALALVDMGQHLTYLGETLRILGAPHSVRDRPDALQRVPARGHIELRNVTFGYVEHRPVLRDFSLMVPAGQKLAIVGPSGAGKSTLIHLVQRLHDVEEGEILIDGFSVQRLKQDMLRAAAAVVPQDVTLFHRSILENIRFAKPGATDEDVFAAARAAYSDDFIRELPHGYHTIVGERGAKLSGGQRQRIGIARAFLKDSPIIILDEATSALDTRSELEVQAALARLLRDRTVLAVAHRLSSIAGFDRVIVLVNGAIVDDGAPAELRQRGGTFSEMWSLQAGALSTAAE
jgi:ATP-binding cassette subfamily B protein